MARKAQPPSAFVKCQHCDHRYRRINHWHLRKHGYEGEHPVLDYKSEFGLRSASSPDSRHKMSQAKESFWQERGQHWTREKVVQHIQRLHHAGRRPRRKRVPGKLYTIGCRLFGSWRAAVEAAGFEYENVSGVHRWDREKVIEEIQQLAAAGVPLHSTHVKKRYPELHRAAIKEFPHSWVKALRAAGYLSSSGVA